MRTTVDLPDALFRRTKAAAALRGSTLKELIIHAIEREVTGDAAGTERRVEFPIVRLPRGKKIDLTGFDFDDLLT